MPFKQRISRLVVLIGVAVLSLGVGIAVLLARADGTPAEPVVRSGDDVPAATVNVGNALVIATRDFGSDNRAGLRVFMVRDGVVSEMPAPPGAESFDDGLGIALDRVADRPCIQFSTRGPDIQEFNAVISCFEEGKWTAVPDVNTVRMPMEWIDGFAVRNEQLVVALYQPNPRKERFLRLEGDTWKPYGKSVQGRNLVVAFNPASARQAPSVTYEYAGRGSTGFRRIDEIGDDSRRALTRRLRAPYGAQTGPSAFAANNWLLTESRSVDDEPFAFRVKRYSRGKWIALRPGNLIRSRSFAQGGLGFGARNSVWVAWSEQGRVSNRGVPVSVFAARINTRRMTVGTARRLWKGSVGGFPPVPRVVQLDGRSYALFERPTKLGSLKADSVLMPLDRKGSNIVLPE